MGSQSIPTHTGTSRDPLEVCPTSPGIYSSIRNRLTLQLDSEATYSLSIEFRGDLVMRRILGVPQGPIPAHGDPICTNHYCSSG